VIFEFAVPASVVMDSVGSKLAAMIEYQLPQGTKPPEFFYQLIDYLHARSKAVASMGCSDPKLRPSQ
jgi:hypothetical protein